MQNANHRSIDVLIATLTMLLLVSGCSQSQHRLAADQEAYCVIAERNRDPRWAAQDVSIDIDSRSRYFDPYDPDCSPIPTDDPASHRYMHCVDGKEGWEHWGDNGIRKSLENPQWRQRLYEYVDMTDDDVVRLDVDSALRLAYIHSPQHQRALETLYLTSLDVTGQRFQLDTQFFGGNNFTYNHQGDVVPTSIVFNPVAGNYEVNGPFNGLESNRRNITSDLSAQKRFATAGQLLVGFANSFALEFTGDNVSLGSSLANFTFIQPLLRGAGRDVALEQLTLAERRLLGNLRAYSQFRQGFFTQVVIGELGVTGPQRGGLGTTLQSFSGFGGVNGYLGLLQQAQQIRNTQDNLRLQLRTRDRLEALYDNELIDIVQVDQFRQNIEVTRANLLDQTNSLKLAVDNYKTGILGLPADLPVEVEETLVEGFQLIPTEANPILESLLELQDRIGEIGELTDLNARVAILKTRLEDIADQEVDEVDSALRQLQGFVEAVGRRLKSLLNDDTINASAAEPNQDEEEETDEAEEEALELIAAQIDEGTEQLQERFDEAANKLQELSDDLTDENLEEAVEENAEWIAETLKLCHGVVLLQSAVKDFSSEPEHVIDDITQFEEPVKKLLESARADLDRMDEITPERERFMREDEKLLFQRDRERLHLRMEELTTGEDGFDAIIERLEEIRQSYTTKTRVKTIRSLTAWIQSYLQLVERLSLVPAQARLEVITVENVELDPDEAFRIALTNRLDFMNGRAALVDSWRGIQVAADALQSNLTITGTGNVGTARNNSLDFRAGTGRLQLGVEFDAPLARLLERNGYRESLITYQRNRRNLIQSHDSLQRGLRALLRTLEQRRLQLEIQRRAVSIALRRVDQTQLSLQTPPPQGQPGVRPQINPTTAINLLGAQSSLQNSQNSFLAAWLNYYAARLRLFRELGVMQMDPNGRWIESTVDFGAKDQSSQVSVEEPLPPPVPDDMLDPQEVLDQPVMLNEAPAR